MVRVMSGNAVFLIVLYTLNIVCGMHAFESRQPYFTMWTFWGRNFRSMRSIVAQTESQTYSNPSTILEKCRYTETLKLVNVLIRSMNTFHEVYFDHHIIFPEQQICKSKPRRSLQYIDLFNIKLYAYRMSKADNPTLNIKSSQHYSLISVYPSNP